ncbi:8-amino-7-oxononanoate synthase [Psychrobacter sp. FDAARGOS_221]|uniref:8-amino-7-oxononanoate synthase n=1 Tax=Psychrobacter sp. FDAARGOS_221 TaxID=1975705 RepID=UPI000BB54EFD|nr:8-amino-7-oxononanoate synthase [Psychrobacter sp. FDAARGOS_221]PNK60736.1 8-amino-7-oxononanoate synthase [Psychrobacter sp. FDAARGOS_221]
MKGPTRLGVMQLLDTLKSKDQYRKLPPIKHQDQWIILNNQRLLNISSNDYLGLGNEKQLQLQFLNYLQQMPDTELPKMGSTSSRLLTGNHSQLPLLEAELLDWYKLALPQPQRSTSSKAVLVVNSGYHANIGILPALVKLPINTLILTDSLIHASLIDGVRLIGKNHTHCRYQRYRHNDLQHLSDLIKQAGAEVERIIVVTESIFSMDGDRADLKALVALKAQDPRIELYIDEAHAVGVLGHHGLGLAEETETLEDIDYIVGTFGKAFASMGAYVICDESIREWLVNQMRSFIFSTALPPITHCWTRFVLAKMPKLHPLRSHLADISLRVSQAINNDSDSRSNTRYQSPIIPYVLGDNASAVQKALALQQAGFYALPIRPPTVPEGTARIRLVMNAKLSNDDCERLIEQL